MMVNRKKNACVLVTTTLILLSKTANHQHEYQDPKTITTIVRDVVNDDATVDISVFQVGNKYNPAMSIFSTDVLQHYGNGKLQFNIAGFSECISIAQQATTWQILLHSLIFHALQYPSIVHTNN